MGKKSLACKLHFHDFEEVYMNGLLNGQEWKRVCLDCGIVQFGFRPKEQFFGDLIIWCSTKEQFENVCELPQYNVTMNRKIKARQLIAKDKGI